MLISSTVSSEFLFKRTKAVFFSLKIILVMEEAFLFPVDCKEKRQACQNYPLGLIKRLPCCQNNNGVTHNEGVTGSLSPWRLGSASTALTHSWCHVGFVATAGSDSLIGWRLLRQGNCHISRLGHLHRHPYTHTHRHTHLPDTPTPTPTDTHLPDTPTPTPTHTDIHRHTDTHTHAYTHTHPHTHTHITSHDLQRYPFSINLDECSNNANNRILTILVS